MAADKATKKKKIAVIGAGHVGLVTAAAFAELGHSVTCVDNDKKKIVHLKKQILPFFEPELEELVKKNIRKKKLSFSHNVGESIRLCNILFIAVGTPPQADGAADLSAVENIARLIARNMKEYTLIVEKSTVPVQTGIKIKETIMRYRRGDIPFDVASNPEFLREGKAVYDCFYPARIVIGVETERAEKILKDLYAPLKVPIITTDMNTAEIIKHASNSFLATKISFINAVSRICDLTGADVKKVAQGMGLDPRIGREFLDAGVGYGGFCFPKDVEAFSYISKKVGYEFRLLDEVKKINDDQRRYFVEKIREHLWVLKDKKIAVLGLAFKPDTDDMRFAPSIEIIHSLVSCNARLRVYDPQAMNEAKQFLPKRGVRYAETLYEAVRGCDCACFLTQWQEFVSADFKKIKTLMKLPLIIDGRNMFDKKELIRIGFTYASIGR
ncbi:MAG: UDP-glucose/GDP-mannose dehydrogenase family protein [Candidatus Omnitrophica bacterium]|nr:UDP-glucose/GDP-mannose dehydrogenase family protein [Candidatus Omnitrophota bacterium]